LQPLPLAVPSPTYGLGQEQLWPAPPMKPVQVALPWQVLVSGSRLRFLGLAMSCPALSTAETAVMFLVHALPFMIR